MNKKDFLDKLRQAPREWLLIGETNKIRTSDESCLCPISAVVSELVSKHVYTFRLEAPELGMKIIATADGFVKSKYFDVHLRKELLEACGLH